jgi:uncharacterized protein YycO
VVAVTRENYHRGSKFYHLFVAAFSFCLTVMIIDQALKKTNIMPGALSFHSVQPAPLLASSVASQSKLRSEKKTKFICHKLAMTKRY